MISVGQAAGGDDRALAQLVLDAVAQAVDLGGEAVDRAGLDRLDGATCRARCGAATSSTARSAAARPTRASMQISMPGAIAPPRYSPLAETASQVVAVPKSATIVGPP